MTGPAFRAEAGALQPALVSWRRDFHRVPRLAEYQQHVPGCYMLLDSGNAETGLAMEHHSPRFDFDERALAIGAALPATTAARFLIERVRNQ